MSIDDEISRGEQLRDAGMQLADDAANEDWKQLADKALYLVCHSQAELTVDDVTEILQENDVHTKNLSALGAVMKRGQKAGWCVPTDRVTQARRPEQHRCSRRVWVSKIFTSLPSPQ